VSYHARELPGCGAEKIRVARPGSLFAVKETRFAAFGRPLHRLFSRARQLGVITVVIEKLDEAGELAEETAEMKARDGEFQSAEHWRVCFLAEQEALLGYAILRLNRWQSKRVGCVYESVMTRLDRGHNYVRNDPTWNVRCGEGLYEIAGHLFAEQNNLTNVCAHAALRTVCCNGSAGENLSYAAINQLLEVDHSSKRVGEYAAGEKLTVAGVSLADIKKVLEKQNIGCRLHYYGHPGLMGAEADGLPEAPYSFQRALYAGMESVYPALLIFGRADSEPVEGDNGKPKVGLLPSSFAHVLPVFGHTFNQDTWVPAAETTWFRPNEHFFSHYLPSDLWLSAFIGHDDSLGSNFCLPKHYLQPLLILENDGRQQTSNGAIAVLQTFPEKADRDPILAERLALRDINFTFIQGKWMASALSGFHKAMEWIDRINHARDARHHDSLILRPLLVSGRNYMQHLSLLRGWDTNEAITSEAKQTAAGIEMDAFYWMIEFSVLELFPANLRKLGEVLVRAEDGIADMMATKLMRLPGLLLKRIGPGFNQGAWEACLSGIYSHTAVYGCEEGDPAGAMI
jgi:hypothetical protein